MGREAFENNRDNWEFKLQKEQRVTERNNDGWFKTVA